MQLAQTTAFKLILIASIASFGGLVQCNGDLDLLFQGVYWPASNSSNYPEQIDGTPHLNLSLASWKSLWDGKINFCFEDNSDEWKIYKTLVEGAVRRISSYIPVNMPRSYAYCNLAYHFVSSASLEGRRGQFQFPSNQIYISNEMDLRQTMYTIFHETLHALGLDHTDRMDSIMRKSITPLVHQYLFPGDVKALQSLWGIRDHSKRLRTRPSYFMSMTEPLPTTNMNISLY